MSEIIFGGAFSPPVLAQHAAIDAAAARVGATGVEVALEPCGPGDPSLSERVRRRWLERVHPWIRVFDTGRNDRWATSTLVATTRAGDHQSRLVAADPARHWPLLHPLVQGDLTVRVCVVGAESTGKSTLVRALAKAHNTHEVGEFGREYTVAKKSAGTNDRWTTDDFVQIALEQQRLEDVAAVGAGPLFFCDTDAMTTALWHERYQGHASSAVDALGRSRRYDLFVLCNIDIPWEQDEIRLGADSRSAMHARFLEVLDHDRDEPWILVSGTVEQRMAMVAGAIADQHLLRADGIFATHRQHLR